MNISVIIPVYNAEKYISKAVDSALQFDFVAEVVLIEDGSPDNAFEVCKKIALENTRVKLFQHPNGENRGAGASRNLGLKHASSEYIAFLDADDYYLPNRFLKDREIFDTILEADGSYNAIGVHYYDNDQKNSFEEHFGNGLTTIKSETKPEELFERLINYKKKNGHFSLDGLTIKSSSLKKSNVFFNENLMLHQDAEFIYKLSFHLRLYSSNIYEAVANRGVHGENRITSSFNDLSKKIKNQNLFYSELIKWCENENIDRKYIIHLKRIQISITSIGKNRIVVFFYCIYYLFVDPKMISKKLYYNRMHYRIFGSGKISKMIFKIKEKVFKTFGINDLIE